MSFDQDPNEQANISGADFAIICDEMQKLRMELGLARHTIAAQEETISLLNRQIVSLGNIANHRQRGG